MAFAAGRHARDDALWDITSSDRANADRRTLTNGQPERKGYT